MHQGTQLKEALDLVRSATLFWQREVYERCQPESGKGKAREVRLAKSPRSPYSKSKGKGKDDPGKGKSKKGYTKQDAWARPAGQYTRSSQSHGDGQSHQGKKEWPQGWARTNPQKLAFCEKYHLHNNCAGSCGRSHNCPVVQSDGFICNAPPRAHKPSECPRKGQ